MAEQILYQDKTITMTNTYITINKYYFPLATSKTIMFSEIESIEISDTQGMNHSWGLNTKLLNNWFPLDSKRQNKKKFVAIKMKNRNIKPSFTPDDSEKVAKIIWQNHTPQGRQQLERRTNQAGKQTQFAQQQVLERMQQQKQETTMNDLKIKN